MATNTMDIPVHIINAVRTSPPTPTGGFESKDQQRFSPPGAYHSYGDYNKGFHSSADDLSTTSISEPDQDYSTDLTSPPSSESCADEMSSEEVEDFKDREYPQLKGKTYLDHGGTTVRKPTQGI
jgi:molybdenum cofactor sulfurtransferase